MPTPEEILAAQQQAQDPTQALYEQLMAREQVAGAAKRKALEDELAQRKQNAPTAGQIDLTPAAQYLDDLYGGNSAKTAASQNAKQAAYGKRSDELLDELTKLKGDNVSPYLTAHTADLNRQSAEKRANSRDDLLQKGIDARIASLGATQGIRADRLVGSVAGAFDNDARIKDSIAQHQAIERGLHTLGSGKKITPGVFNEIQTDFANAITRGGSHAEGAQAQLKFHTLEQDYTNFLQKVSGDPQYYDNPKAIAMLNDLGTRLRKAYGSNIASRAKEIAGGRHYGSPEAQDTLQGKVDEYSKYSEPEDVVAPQIDMPSAPSPTGLSPDKAKRLEELRAKKAKGEI